ncbi:hypothetical protein ACFYUV_38245 [Nonomuraea sp. NPDC003560]|uniref:hypothetical protein n=1 Tax=Nonomuraea sp. NPDC003560 TaxID=3364341 RepID=UPI0036994DE9
MSSTYIAPATTPALGPVRARLAYRRRPPADGLPETVEFYATTDTGSEFRYGFLFLPRDAAYDVISRLEDIPATISTVDRRTAGHVRWLLDEDYSDPADEPTEFVLDLISLIMRAGEEDRRRLGRTYPAYVVAVAIATGSEGVDALRRWHESLPPAPASVVVPPMPGTADVETV